MSNSISANKDDMHAHESGCAWFVMTRFSAIFTKASGSIPSMPLKSAVLPGG
jgi:hypothetical protein